MKKINDEPCYLIAECAKLLNLSPHTIKRKIEQHKLNAYQIMGQYYIREQDIQRYKDTITKIPIVITKSDYEADQWLHEKENLHKLKLWSEQPYIQWNTMAIDDYIAYWKYLIQPQWVAQKSPYGNKYPSVKWLEVHFRGFKRAIEQKYLEKIHGIRNISMFFNYIK